MAAFDYPSHLARREAEQAGDVYEKLHDPLRHELDGQKASVAQLAEASGLNPNQVLVRSQLDAPEQSPFRRQLLRVGVLIASSSGLADATQDIEGARRGIDAEIDGDTGNERRTHH